MLLNGASQQKLKHELKLDSQKLFQINFYKMYDHFLRKSITAILISTSILCMYNTSCKKAEGMPDIIDPPDDTITIIDPVDPELDPTIGFFMGDWQEKNFTAPSYTDGTVPAAAAATITIDRANVLTKVPRFLFGNNANLWMGQYVTEPALINHINQLQPHIIRFPGGSISDVFFWNAEKNIKPAGAPIDLMNAAGEKSPAGFWYGKNTDSWTCSVDNYYSMLQQTGSQGIITINYGFARYGTGTNPVADAAHLAADWVRYDKGRTKYWEIGNEHFGDWEAGYRIDLAANKDGQPEYTTGALYAAHFKVFADSMRKAANESGATIFIGALMADAESQPWQTNTYKTWNSGLFSTINNTADFYVVHSYYTPYNTNSNASEILNSAEIVSQKMMAFVKKTMQDAGAVQKPVALDEWNIFATGSKQQVSHVNGMHSVLLLSEMLKNKYGMACRWDLANGWSNGDDHGMFSNGDEPGVSKSNPRPVFYHEYFYQKFLGDRVISSTVQNGTDIYACASSYTSGQLAVAVVNKSATAKPVQISVKNFKAGTRFYWYELTGSNDNGEFSRKVIINGKGPDGEAGGPTDYATLKAYSAVVSGGIRINVPARSVVFLAIDKK